MTTCHAYPLEVDYGKNQEHESHYVAEISVKNTFIHFGVKNTFIHIGEYPSEQRTTWLRKKCEDATPSFLELPTPTKSTSGRRHSVGSMRMSRIGAMGCSTIPLCRLSASVHESVADSEHRSPQSTLASEKSDYLRSPASSVFSSRPPSSDSPRSASHLAEAHSNQGTQGAESVNAPSEAVPPLLTNNAWRSEQSKLSWNASVEDSARASGEHAGDYSRLRRVGALVPLHLSDMIKSPMPYTDSEWQSASYGESMTESWDMSANHMWDYQQESFACYYDGMSLDAGYDFSCDSAYVDGPSAFTGASGYDVCASDSYMCMYGYGTQCGKAPPPAPPPAGA